MSTVNRLGYNFKLKVTIVSLFTTNNNQNDSLDMLKMDMS